VYSIDDTLLTHIPLLTAADPSLTVILFGFTAKHVSNTIGSIKDGAFEGFTEFKPAQINAHLQSQITRAVADVVPLGNGTNIVTELNSDQKTVDDFIRRITFIKTQSAV